ncbi:hypothetical protein P154DRAFT_437298 [Amniculicola lignicola CBS 123094]|uniref:Uncharacterized protein n=1 Tax=Amniculicola lignicola CBS 123094 TaxID=1392246 RepID=A0A6A5WE25_9PLEO|nr:hypothetical protein P154DRAFT_437298 [Amniculicola lignicola CBS 123094]
MSPAADIPPPLDTTASPPSNPANPISPVSVTRHTSFPHQTSGSVPPTIPFIEVDTPAINDEPIELDSEALTREEAKRRGTGDSVGMGKGKGWEGLEKEAEGEEEFLGEGGKGEGRVVREKRAAILASRSKDPAVLVDLPDEPTAVEVEAAKSAEGAVTPGLPSSEIERVEIEEGKR